MNTKLLTVSFIFALSASASQADQLNSVNETQNISLIESSISMSTGRNQIASSHIISKHHVSSHSLSNKSISRHNISRHNISTQGASSLLQSSIENNKGRNIELQSFVLEKLKKTHEMQFAIQNL